MLGWRFTKDHHGDVPGHADRGDHRVKREHHIQRENLDENDAERAPAAGRLAAMMFHLEILVNLTGRFRDQK